ncbi:MAG: HlyD family efflux transporter periplasmic adaptor subunit [Fluviicola sp.]|nr:HlyD family efflux transporter periplasmic adaptor subunit [Fluviicola sp.]MBP6270919.1 HlyD family efflux transporter periplasmic adaptor subunit [Fluviicola sp.]
MQEIKDIDISLKSEPMNEMLSHPPSWIVRSGNSIFFLIIFLMLTLSWIIKYPDEINGNALVTTKQPPIEIVNQSYAQLIAINVKSEQKVKKGQLLIQFDNKAAKKDIEFITTYLSELKLEESKQIPTESKLLQLGTFQDSWINLQTKINEWNTNLSSNLFNEQINSIQREIIYRQRLQTISSRKIKLSESEYNLIAEDLKASQKLLEQNAISKQNLNQDKRNETQAMQSVQSQKEQYVQNLIQLNTLKSQLLNLKIENQTKLRELKSMIESAVSNLKSQLYDWTKNAIWTSPCDGKVLFNKILQKDKFYKPNEASIVVVPNGSKYIAFAKITSIGAGKVKTGQQVFIELEDFPKNEFGMIEGFVSSITPIEKDGTYEVKIQLKNQLKTTYKKQIPLKAQLKGQVKIITKKKRLLERFFEKIIDLVQ